MVASQARLAVQPSKFAFQPGGKCGTRISDLLPHTRDIADDICVLRSLHTEAINHDPAITFFQSGSQLPGRPSMGAWVDYGLGRLSDNLPAFVVLVSVNAKRAGQGLLARLWGSGFLPSAHQGVQFRSAGEPVLYLNDPPGLTRERRRAMLDGIGELNRLAHAQSGDPEIETRIAQGELAYRMQASVPELMDLKGESAATLAGYGEDVEHARLVRAQLPPRAPARRARRALHPALPPRLGSPRRPARQPAQHRPGRRSAQRRARARSQAARACSTTRL